MANPERYATIQQLRDEGLPGDAVNEVTDARALILLERASELVEKITNNNLFYEVSGTFVFDGTNSYLLQLPLAIIEVSSLKINNETVELPTTEYRVFNGKQPPNDDRHYPKIELRRNSPQSIYTTFSPTKFLKGYDQTIVGKFGFVEPDGSTPPAITECVMAIAMMTWEDLYYRFYVNGDGGGGGPGPMVGPIKREITDAHEVEWWQPDTGATEQGMIVPQYVHGRLKNYRAPIYIGVTTHRFTPYGFGHE